MSSTMLVYRDAADAADDKILAEFGLPVKWAFGRRFCDTDGSIGHPTECEPTAVLEVIAECEKMDLYAHQRADLQKVKKAAEEGARVFIDWVH